MADFPPVTPADSPSDAAGWASVTPSGQGTAPYDIQAPMDGSISGKFDAANSLSGAGVLYAQGPRQQEAHALLTSPQGAGAMNVITGFPDYESANVMPDYGAVAQSDGNPVPLPLIIS
jgi:hypothetical protein